MATPPHSNLPLAQLTRPLVLLLLSTFLPPQSKGMPPLPAPPHGLNPGGPPSSPPSTYISSRHPERPKNSRPTTPFTSPNSPKRHTSKPSKGPKPTTGQTSSPKHPLRPSGGPKNLSPPAKSQDSPLFLGPLPRSPSTKHLYTTFSHHKTPPQVAA